jgi:hypothetical protein
LDEAGTGSALLYWVMFGGQQEIEKADG